MARKRRSGGLGIVSEAANRTTGVEFLRLEDGDVEILRVLQNTWRDGYTHRTPITKKDGDEIHVDRMCLDQKDEGIPCPGCQDDLRRGYKFWVKVIVRGDPDADDASKQKDRLVLWSGGIKIAKQLDKLAAKSPLTERDIELEREGSGKNDTTYTATFYDDEENDLTEADLKLAEGKIDIDRYTKIFDYDEFYDNDLQKDDDDEDRGEKSLRRGSAFKKRRDADDDAGKGSGRKVAARRRSSSTRSSGNSSSTSSTSSKPDGLKSFGVKKKEAEKAPSKTTVRRRRSR